MEAGWIVLGAMGLIVIALAAWGLRRDPQPPSRPPGKEHRLQARDGTWVQSHGERRIANWLSAHEIPYRYEPEMANGLTPDFHLEGTNILIEYWGMAGHSPYEDRMIEKLERYDDHGLDVISLFPPNVREVDALLGDELAKRGLPAGATDDPPSP